MFELYLFCLILGGGLLGFSLFAGGDQSTDVHGHLDLHTETGHSLDIHSDSSLSHIDVQHTEISKNDTADSVKLVSFRNIVYFTAFFGLTGTVLSYLSFIPFITFLSSIAMGGFAGWFGYKLMKYLAESESGQSLDLSELIGKQAIVTININKNGRGKVQTQCKGQSIELSAVIDESTDIEQFKMREKVLITDIKSNTAYIVSADF